MRSLYPKPRAVDGQTGAGRGRTSGAALLPPAVWSPPGAKHKGGPRARRCLRSGRGLRQRTDARLTPPRGWEPRAGPAAARSLPAPVARRPGPPFFFLSSSLDRVPTRGGAGDSACAGRRLRLASVGHGALRQSARTRPPHNLRPTLGPARNLGTSNPGADRGGDSPGRPPPRRPRVPNSPFPTGDWRGVQCLLTALGRSGT